MVTQARKPDRTKVLLLASDEERSKVLTRLALASPGTSACESVTVPPNAADRPASDLPNPAGYGAVIVDGCAPCVHPEWLKDLRRAVEGGTSLLVITSGGGPTGGGPTGGGQANAGDDPDWWHLLGARPTARFPSTEWFVKVQDRDTTLTRRLPAEFPHTDAPVALQPETDACRPVLAISIAYSDHVVLTNHDVGKGRVVTSGLGTTTAALTNPEFALALQRALAPAPAARSDHPLGMAVLGYGPFGGMGLYHGLAARAVDGIELVAAADNDEGRRKAAEAEFPGLRAYEGVADLVADGEVELVVVATPPSTHFTLALQLIQAGKHVALEKPMCLTVAEADHLIAAAKEKDVALTVHQSRRWDPDFVAIKRLIEAGTLGEVFNVETFVGGFEHPCRAWHSEVSISGGAVYDWGSHHLDWILQLMGGFPKTLSAHGHKRVWHDITNLDQVRVRLAWQDGREAEFVQSDLAAVRRPKFFVQGTAGTLVGHYRQLGFERVEPGLGYVSELPHHAEAPADLSYATYSPGGSGVAETALPPAVVGRYGFHRNLADHIEFGEPLAVEPDSARKVVALLEAAQRATNEGNTTIELPEL